jgi:signal transduction histidine kinase
VASVAERIQPRGPQGSGGWLESACKLIITVRMSLLLVTLLMLSHAGDPELLAAAIVIAAVASIVPLRYWSRVGPTLVRHPAWLAGELILSTLILVLTGVQSPFFYYTLATALLGGMLYDAPGAAVFAPMLVGSYLWTVHVRAGIDSGTHTFQTLVGQPALYLIVAAAGAAARRLLDRQAAYEAALAEHERREAAEEERARLARDVHDSLAKTVAGIGFAALALARKIDRDPQQASADARGLAEDARRATREAREIIESLRSEGAQRPGGAAGVLQDAVRRWAEGTPVGVEVAIEDARLNPVAARELEWILREALANVRQHAAASRVAVRLRTLGGRVVLTVADDGRGFAAPDDLSELSGGHHFGVRGMRERAQLAGGDLDVESAPGEGCVLSVWVPLDGAAAAAPVEESAPAPVAAVPRPVTGLDWR